MTISTRRGWRRSVFRRPRLPARGRAVGRMPPRSGRDPHDQPSRAVPPDRLKVRARTARARRPAVVFRRHRRHPQRPHPRVAAKSRWVSGERESTSHISERFAAAMPDRQRSARGRRPASATARRPRPPAHHRGVPVRPGRSARRVKSTGRCSCQPGRRKPWPGSDWWTSWAPATCRSAPRSPSFCAPICPRLGPSSRPGHPAPPGGCPDSAISARAQILGGAGRWCHIRGAGFARGGWVIGKPVRPGRSSVRPSRQPTAVGRRRRGICPDNDRPVEVGGFRLDPRPRPEG